MLTYETYRAMFEGRNARLFAPASGTLLWMSNPAQPSFVWQLYHHDLDPTAAMFGTKVANERVHVQLTPDGGVQLVNTLPQKVDATIVMDAYDADGTYQRSIVGDQSLPPLATTTSGSFSSPIVRLRLRDAKGKTLSENVYWQAAKGSVDDVSFLGALPKVTLEGSARRTRNGMTVTLRNPSKTVALLTHLSLRDKDGRRVLPVFYSDNDIHVFPGESRTVTIEGEGATQVFVDGWNLRGVKGSGLKLDADAQPEPPLPPLPPHPALPGTVLSIDCGGEDRPGPWNSDDDFVSGGNEERQPGRIIGYDLPPDVLATERWGESTYTIAVPAGTYTVRLVFAETSQPRVGGRRFAVTIGRQRVLDEFDIFAEAGGANRALVKEFKNIAPDRNGNLVIGFRKGSANEPEVRAIQILP